MNIVPMETSKRLWHPQLLIIDGAGANVDLTDRGVQTTISKESSPLPDDVTRLKEGKNFQFLLLFLTKI